MAWFKDRLGRKWVIELTMALADAVEQTLGIDLLKWIDDPAGADNRTVYRIVGCLVAEQIEAQGLDARSFAAGFDGPALERAGAALVESLLFFCQPQKVARATLPKLLEAMEAANERAAAKIEAQDFRRSAGALPASAGSTQQDVLCASSATQHEPGGPRSGTGPAPS